MPTPPPEPLLGQESDPPDLRLVVVAAIRLLRDMQGQRVEGDLELRRVALVSVLRRLHRRLVEGG